MKQIFGKTSPCLRFKCVGQYKPETRKDDYYGRLYASGNVERIFAQEHTGLLKLDVHEQIETSFIKGTDPGDPNLLSCTPTLELGIDIGDLSTVILCSVPPASANYVQRIGRSGRKDGNSLNITVANGRSHDLYYYHEPDDMVAGNVGPPGCYLNASAILERQFTGFCFDNWYVLKADKISLPNKLGQVLNNVKKGENSGYFPYNFIQFIEAERDTLLDDFINIFEDHITEDTKKRLYNFVFGGAEDIVELRYKIINGISEVYKEREKLRKRIQRINSVIRQKEKNPAKDKNYESELNELKQEKSALNQIIKDINDKETFNFFTDEGLLPNYAFPEAGVVLRSIIYRLKKKVDQFGKHETKSFEYERSGERAISELAPSNRFYAEGRRVVIDQINMALSDIETWRFCNDCSHHEQIIEKDDLKSCPNCDSQLWSDAGQKRDMIRMRQVIATTSEKDSKSYDDSDDREPEFYNKNMLVNTVSKYIEKAYKIDDPELPFGFEFYRRATFREINFGKKDIIGEEIDVAGRSIPKTGFIICKDCGKVHLDNTDYKDFKHTLSCKFRESQSEKNYQNSLYLYRDFSSEAIRILVPTVTSAKSDVTISSFMAALFLGLKRKFKGKIDHLQTAVIEEPIQFTEIRKRYVVLYDTITGGTGYLKELMKSDEQIVEVFELALESIRNCVCQKDPEKDGCYHCLYQYRKSYDMPEISSSEAINLLTKIINLRKKIVETDTIKNISFNTFFESDLEEKFINRLKDLGSASELKNEIINGKPGWIFTIDNISYQIEPQVEMGKYDGLSQPLRADFVFYPSKDIKSKPIVVFTDGLLYHANPKEGRNRIYQDIAQRMDLIKSGKFYIWSLTWDDVNDNNNQHKGDFLNLLKMNKIVRRLIDAYSDKGFNTNKLYDIYKQNSFEIFMGYLSKPDSKMWQSYSFIQTLIWINPNFHQRIGVIEQLKENFLNDTSNMDKRIKELDSVQDGKFIIGYQNTIDDNDKVVIEILVYGVAEKIRINDMNSISLFCKLYDDDSAVIEKSYKSIRIGYLRHFNIMQFLNRSFFITTKGIEA